MTIQIVPLLSFVFVTTFTPGPNTLSSGSMGIIHGYRKTLSYLLGITLGFFLVMVLCGYLSHTLLTLMPTAQNYLRLLGAGYISWLAIGVLHSGDANVEPETSAKSFLKGLLLQLCNPKVLVYGLTLYSTFLAPVNNRWEYLIFSALLFALTAFMANSTWALGGAALRARMSNETCRKRVNTLLAILLFYSALSLSGLWGWIS